MKIYKITFSNPKDRKPFFKWYRTLKEANAAINDLVYRGFVFLKREYVYFKAE